MNKITTILIDDEIRGLSSLQKLLQLHCPEVEVIATATNATEAIEKITELSPQLIFLDIAMPEKNGLELLKDMPSIHFEIIFVTAHNNYMLQAFHFSAIDYLLKPVEDDLLKEAVKRAGRRIEEKSNPQSMETLLYNVQRLNMPQKMKLCILSVKGFQVVTISDIIYCEASSNYTNFYFSNRTPICTSRPIHEYDEILGDSNFIRVHKSYLVNVEHIKEYLRGEGGSVLLSNGQEIEVARRKKDILMAKLKTYYKF
jgi:two-component system, LytTR family, response regulator